jgi:hypothetical protein
MNNRERTPASAATSEIQRLVKRAGRQGLELDKASAKTLSSLGGIASTRKLDQACRLVHAGRNKNLQVGCRDALRRIDMCGGHVEEAIRRMLVGGAEAIEGVPEMVQYAADRGVSLTPRSIYKHFGTRGRSGTRLYIDKLGAIMDESAILGALCTQNLATQRLSRAGEDVERAITEFRVQQRRRADRRSITCRVTVPPRAPSARSNALAGCGCQCCRDRLAADMQRYINKMISSPFFIDLDRDEARGEANLALIQAIETWPGGNFTGWFATCFKRRVQTIYASRSAAEKEMLSLDAEDVLSDDDGGRAVPLAERIPDRTKDVITIVLLRERVAEAALRLRQVRADRSEQFTDGFSEKQKLPAPSRALRLISSSTDTVSKAQSARPPACNQRAA